MMMAIRLKFTMMFSLNDLTVNTSSSRYSSDSFQLSTLSKDYPRVPGSLLTNMNNRQSAPPRRFETLTESEDVV